MAETIPPTAPFSVATQELGGDQFQRVLVGQFYRCQSQDATGTLAYSGGDAIGAGGTFVDVPVGVYIVRDAHVILVGADVPAPGIQVALVPSDPGSSFTPAADGAAWTPPLDGRGGGVAFQSEWDDPVAVLGQFYGSSQRENRLLVAPTKPDGSWEASATATLYVQALTAASVTFGTLDAVVVNLLLEYVSPLPVVLGT